MTSEYKDKAWAKWKNDTYDKAEKADKQAKLVLEEQPSIKGVEMGQLIPYYIAGRNCPQIFNGVQVVKDRDKDKSKEFMCAKDFKITGLPGR